MPYTHIFAGNPLDRGDRERRDEELIKRMMRQDNARMLPFHRLMPLVRRNMRGNPHAELAWISHEFVDDLPKTATGKIQRFKLRENA